MSSTKKHKDCTVCGGKGYTYHRNEKGQMVPSQCAYCLELLATDKHPRIENIQEWTIEEMENLV